MIYYVILIALIIFAFIDICNEKYTQVRNFSFAILSIIIFLLAALRDGIGYDFESYRNIYNEIHSEIFSISYFSKMLNYELGFVALSKICTNFTILIFIFAILGVFVKICLIKKYSTSGMVCMILYFSGVFLNFDMGVIRQGVSISFILMSLIYIQRQELVKFSIVVALGSMFHISTLVVVPFYFFGRKKIPYSLMYLLALLALGFTFFDLKSIIVALSNYLPFEIASSKIMFYSSVTSSSLTKSILKRILFLFIFGEFYRRKHIEDYWARICLNGYFLSILLMGIFSSIDIVGGRGTMGLYFLQIFIFDIIINNCKKIYSKFAVLSIVVLLSLNSMNSLINHGNQSSQPYSPYKSIFSDKF